MIKTIIDKNIISYDLPFDVGLGIQHIEIIYDVDIKEVPVHVCNFMLGMILSEVLSWNNISLEFSEMSQKEIDCINDHIRVNYINNTYGKCGNKAGSVSANRLVCGESTSLLDSSKVLISNGMGKDGLISINLLKEIGLEFRTFTVGNYYQTEGEFDKRINSLRDFSRDYSFDFNIIKTNIVSQSTALKIIPWWLFGLPLSYKFRSKNIVSGFEISFSKTSIKNGLAPRMNASYFSQAYVSDCTEINFSSLTTCLTQYGIQKLLYDRYPDTLKYQRSCMKKDPACRSPKCVKCVMHSLYAEASGHDPEKIFLPRFSGDIYKSKHPFDNDTIRNAIDKKDGKKYEKWFEQASDKILDITWMGDRLKNIINNHFDLYTEDPGNDGLGFEYIPPQWKRFTTTGFDKFWQKIT